MAVRPDRNRELRSTRRRSPSRRRSSIPTVRRSTRRRRTGRSTGWRCRTGRDDDRQLAGGGDPRCETREDRLRAQPLRQPRPRRRRQLLRLCAVPGARRRARPPDRAHRPRLQRELQQPLRTSRPDHLPRLRAGDVGPRGRGRRARQRPAPRRHCQRAVERPQRLGGQRARAEPRRRQADPVLHACGTSPISASTTSTSGAPRRRS